MNNEIKLNTIAVYNNKEYELQDLLNGLLNKLNMLEEYIEELDDETIDTCLYEITKETKEKLLSILKGDKLMNDEIKEILDYISDRVIEKEKWNKVRDYITNLQHTEDLYNQLLKDYDEEVEENIKLTKLWKNEVEKRRKAVEYVEEAKEQDFMWTPIFMKELLNILNGDKSE